jgi:2-succinyl-6-hydroxy-2,4-cyclohexadiene-1-carboxylate synthase
VKILLIPGFMQGAGAWAPVAGLLEAEHDVTPLEHREHTYEGRLEEIAAAGEGAALCGYSLGGRLALRAALRAPERHAAVITVGSSAGIEEPESRSTRAAADDRLAGWMETSRIEDIVSVWERQALFADQTDALVEDQRAGRLAQEPRSLALLLRTAGQGALPPVWHELETLRPRLLAVAGARDEAYSRVAERMAGVAPDGRAALLEGAGHAAHLQRPEAFAELVSVFLAD